jgi:hypothetical protein
MNSEQTISIVKSHLVAVTQQINLFMQKTFICRGGRMGSGMGLLIEGLWNFHMNEMLRAQKTDIEIAWLAQNHYNDYACISSMKDWNPETREGEFFRIEAKSMNIGVDESKGHFDEIKENISQFDQLLVLVWQWEALANNLFCPKISDQFFGSALDVALLRDELHIARGGSFIDRNHCPDGCVPSACKHHGEPLNASRRRERKSGPESTRVSSATSHAQNFGGLVRMIKTDTAAARIAFRRLRRENEIIHEYISFIHKNFPQEESNQFLLTERKAIAQLFGVDSALSAEEFWKLVRSNPDYHTKLRAFDFQ